MDLRTYRTLFNDGRPVKKGTVTGLVGRILRGSHPLDFQTTTNDLQRNPNGVPIVNARGQVTANRPLVLLVDGDALGDLVGIAHSTYQMLHAVGYNPKDIEEHAKNGLDFKLVVFEDNGSSLAVQGTWDNMVDLAKRLYPELSQILDAHRAMLKAHTFDLILAKDGVKEWDQVQHGDPRYMGPKELLRYFEGQGQGQLVSSNRGLIAVRRFFFDTLHLRRLYSGDGYTYNAAGQRGVPEYVVPTTPLASLGQHLLIDLPKLQLPQATKGGAVRRTMTSKGEFSVPDFFKPSNADVWGYGPNHDRLLDASDTYRKAHGITSAMADKTVVTVLDIDSQKDFVIPGGALFVTGRSGSAAVDDNVRFTEFKYRNLGRITRIANTMDTHPLFAIHARSAWLDMGGQHLAPFTDISLADIESGIARPNPMFASMLGVAPGWLDKQVRHYATELMKGGQYVLKVWTTHCVMGSDGYALAGITQEVRAFHAYVRGVMDDPEIKGGNPLTENYGIMAPEVLTRWDGPTIAQKNTKFLETLLKSDVVVIGGQAASHCVKSSIEQILQHILQHDAQLARKVYLLRNCMSAVVTPAHDYTPEAEAALAKFASAGMHVVDSTTPMEDWPDIRLG